MVIHSSPAPPNDIPMVHELHCMGYALYEEARGEGRKGMLLVGDVIRNRMDLQNRTACVIIKQKKQFSFKYNRKYKLENNYIKLAKIVLDLSYKPNNNYLYFNNKYTKHYKYKYKNHYFW
jgi:spore germination cell wall hydrolase CwlJ-like protein